MTELEYCAVRDIATVRAMQAMLRELVPGCGHEVISESDFASVGKKLAEWEMALNKQFKVRDS